MLRAGQKNRASSAVTHSTFPSGERGSGMAATGWHMLLSTPELTEEMGDYLWAV